jgi:hypothetical protein
MKKKQLNSAIVREREGEEKLTSASQHGGEKHGQILTLEKTCGSVTGYLKEQFTRRVYSQNYGPCHCGIPPFRETSRGRHMLGQWHSRLV